MDHYQGGLASPNPTLPLLHLLFLSLYLVWTQIYKSQMLYWGPGNPIILFNYLQVWEEMNDHDDDGDVNVNVNVWLCMHLDLHDDPSSRLMSFFLIFLFFKRMGKLSKVMCEILDLSHSISTD